MSFDDYFAGKWAALQEPKNVEDPVRFGETGWKQRYYAAKLGIDLTRATSEPESDDGRKAEQLFRTYLEGLCWVLQYYLHGVASWSWFFPFHYAPLAEDLASFLRGGHMDQGAIFELGKPFEPVGQLMAVLPSRSSHAVPRVVRPLMTDDPSSPLAAFYPRDFELDLNHKKFLWQAVALLPFIDEALLLRELERVRPGFTAEEARRNKAGREYLFVRADRGAGKQLHAQLYQSIVAEKGEQGIRQMDEVSTGQAPSVPLDTSLSQGISGSLRPYSDASVPSLPSLLTSPASSLPRIGRLEVVSAVYERPPYHKAERSALLPGIEPFVPQLVESDFRTLVEPRQFQQRGGGGGRAYNNMQQQWQQPPQADGAQTQQQQGPYGVRAIDGAPVQLQGHAAMTAGAGAWPGAAAQGQALLPQMYPGMAGGMCPPAPGYNPGMPPGAYPPAYPPAFPGYPPMPYGAGGYYPPHAYAGMPPAYGAGYYGAPPGAFGMPFPPGAIPMPGAVGAAAAVPAVPGMPYNPAAVQSFLAAPPPPGKPAGWVPPPLATMVPPPLATMVPGFPLPQPPQPPAAPQ